ncbi:hypothetical protein HMPREF0972_00391 [Actinomyces sp. oral taxon 848 str. F0332]|nr:hypothetical protein HMPREF0972_00391 [Actinomyces sp. oral taxon 848 str. F0332]
MGKLLAHPGTLSAFLRKFSTLLGKRGGGLAFRNGARAANGFQLPRGRVPSGRHVRARNASHPEGASSARKRPTPRERSFAEFTLILYFHSVVEIVTIKWRVTFPESSWLRNRAPLRSR